MDVETLPDLPGKLLKVQCVAYKQELLICGGYDVKECYSYHTVKNKYKLICSYPEEVSLWGHCVVKFVSNESANGVTLLSFGGLYDHTLVMHYESVWESEACNKWVPLSDKDDKTVLIGGNRTNYSGVRALVGGSKHHLLFITYPPANIDIFDLKSLQYIKQDWLPVNSRDSINWHCLVSTTTTTTSAVEEKNKSAMLFFWKDKGLAIEYNESKNELNFQILRVGNSLRPSSQYAYLVIDRKVLFFGGYADGFGDASTLVHMYSIEENKWSQCNHGLPISLDGSVGVLSEQGSFVHILGNNCAAKSKSNTHVKLDVRKFITKKSLWVEEEEEKISIQEMKTKLDQVNDNPYLRELQVEFV
ncbi:hypothetical protein RFI_22410, partial [Reticulomyxa filosa]